MKTILVTGGNGQLATCIKDLEQSINGFRFIYVDSGELDITKEADVNAFFSSNDIDWCINCAAYTAVDKAESEKEKAFAVNVLGVKYLAAACKEYNVKMIHVSTDFVFEGDACLAYSESDATNPVGVYGETKLEGEKEIERHLAEHFIFRTSWLYSEHGHNFLKTMLKLSETKSELNIVADQIGTPTYAKDLAAVLLKVVSSNSVAYGLYHYSNEGVASWYDFAHAIFEISENNIKTFAIKTEAYPTPAERPHFSVLDKTKVKGTFNIEISHWRDSLKEAIKRID
ncbi:dTDP-4-dehydrorhamnose reductase [Mangrovimonas sp. YM274]|uniref:dTDP-4-dehydrorhamnose reductase n=1 Tax=Mangrovimonas sp. YM274 TaxID=3070660 RepID=UPI0027DD476F|nr:dTDP-4-dehydrorhamnose reductase [Mangrovimonas sp. YM274]WMI68936.1 dTDP-4-dehydrorhamnose reductase [Mangrovimonas sp. YM274]